MSADRQGALEQIQEIKDKAELDYGGYVGILKLTVLGAAWPGVAQRLGAATQDFGKAVATLQAAFDKLNDTSGNTKHDALHLTDLLTANLSSCIEKSCGRLRSTVQRVVSGAFLLGHRAELCEVALGPTSFEIVEITD